MPTAKNEHKNITILLLFAALFLVRIPFFLTHHIQEDAYITWQCAVNLADHGFYSYNLLEKAGAATTHAYALMSALFRIIFGSHFIPAVLSANTLLLIAGIFFMVKSVVTERKLFLICWVIISITPTALLISYSGMETSLLVFFLGLSCYCLYSGYPTALAVLLALFPFIRPDAIAFACIICLAEYLKDRHIPYLHIASVFTGIFILLAFNYIYFGSLLNQTIIAKQVSYHPPHSFLDTLDSYWMLFRGMMFAPANTHLFHKIGLVFTVAISFIVVIGLLKLPQLRKSLPLWTLIAFALLVPLGYAFGGIVFPWYIWPSNLAIYSVAIILLIHLMNSIPNKIRLLFIYSLVFVVVSLSFVQLLISFSTGTQEYYHRAQVGRYIKEHSLSTDTLFLEPAGYIPFYSCRNTYDERGLGSPTVTNYMIRHPDNWWIRFLKDYRPTFLVQRQSIPELQKAYGYRMEPEDTLWFQDNYALIQEFHYVPGKIFTQSILKYILSQHSHASYYLYKIKS